MTEIRQIIIQKNLNGESAGGIFKALKTGGVKRDFIYRTIKRYRETSSVEDRKRSGRPRSVRTKTLLKAVKQRLRRNPGQSVRKLAAGLKISNGSVHNILKKDLN